MNEFGDQAAVAGSASLDVEPPKNPIEIALQQLTAKGVLILDFDRTGYEYGSKKLDRKFQKRMSDLLASHGLVAEDMRYRAIDGIRLPTVAKHGTDMPQFDNVRANSWPEWSTFIQHPIISAAKKIRQRFKPMPLQPISLVTPFQYSMTTAQIQEDKPAILIYDGTVMPRIRDLHFSLPQNPRERFAALKAVIRVHDNKTFKTLWRNT